MIVFTPLWDKGILLPWNGQWWGTSEATSADSPFADFIFPPAPGGFANKKPKESKLWYQFKLKFIKGFGSRPLTGIGYNYWHVGRWRFFHINLITEFVIISYDICRMMPFFKIHLTSLAKSARTKYLSALYPNFLQTDKTKFTWNFTAVRCHYVTMHLFTDFKEKCKYCILLISNG